MWKNIKPGSQFVLSLIVIQQIPPTCVTFYSASIFLQVGYSPSNFRIYKNVCDGVVADLSLSSSDSFYICFLWSMCTQQYQSIFKLRWLMMASNSDGELSLFVLWDISVTQGLMLCLSEPKKISPCCFITHLHDKHHLSFKLLLVYSITY